VGWVPPQTQQRMKKLSEVPPFEKWRITSDRYLHYCANLHHVHRALEDTVAAITTSPPGEAVRRVPCM
jgi:hypothetical protein